MIATHAPGTGTASRQLVFLGSVSHLVADPSRFSGGGAQVSTFFVDLTVANQSGLTELLKVGPDLVHVMRSPAAGSVEGSTQALFVPAPGIHHPVETRKRTGRSQFQSRYPQEPPRGHFLWRSLAWAVSRCVSGEGVACARDQTIASPLRTSSSALVFVAGRGCRPRHPPFVEGPVLRRVSHSLISTDPLDGPSMDARIRPQAMLG